MKIMKVVYLQEKTEMNNFDSSSSYMGEETWQIGEKFAGEFMSDTVTDIYRSPYHEEIIVEVGEKVALSIPNHAIQRIYYGEG